MAVRPGDRTTSNRNWPHRSHGADCVFDDADPTFIFDIDVTTVNDLTAADRDCLTFGVRMANDSGGNINGVTTSFIPQGSERRHDEQLLAAGEGDAPSDSDASRAAVDGLRYSAAAEPSRSRAGRPGTLTSLEARVIGNRIRVDGRATDAGAGWTAVSDFNFFIDIGLAAGVLTVTATVPAVDTDVDL